jgi:hypothetical protein
MELLLKSDPKSDLYASKEKSEKKNAFNMHMTDERSSIEIHFPDLCQLWGHSTTTWTKF